MTAEFKTQSGGASVVIAAAPFRDAMALKNAIAKELSASGVAFDMKAPLSSLSSVVLAVDSSEAVYKALLPCLVRCTYNGQKIVESIFEDVAAREDYYEVVIECLKANLSPFFKGLASKLNALESLLPQKDSPTLK